MSTRESVAATRAGLARLRPLGTKPAPKGKSPTTEALPDGWYFNETREDQFWKDMEAQQDGARKQLQEDMLKKTEHVTELQDTSNKLRTLLEQFDDIDQESLLTLVQLYDESGGGESMDKYMIMNDSRQHVLDFMNQLKTLSDSQTSLMETLRFWFSTLQGNSQTTEQLVETDKLPSVDEVFKNIAEMMHAYTEKSEQAACLHNDINDFWVKQIAEYRKTVMKRDEEIRKLQAAINESTAAAQARRARKKLEERKNSDAETEREQLTQQLRINQEQKMQIAQLRSALKDTEMQRAMLGLAAAGESKERLDTESLERECDINAMKMEYESRIAKQERLIKLQEETMEELRRDIRADELRFREMKAQLDRVKKEKEELDAALKKQKQLNELEKKKPIKPEGSEEDADRREIYELQLVHEEELRSLAAKHQQELTKERELMRDEFMKEKEEFLKGLETSDSSVLLKSISEECERKVEALKAENEKAKSDLISQMAAKQALLTRQYENRIKAINSAHEVDLVMVKDAARYDLKKAEIELEEKFQLQILELGKERQDKFDEMQRNLAQVTKDLKRAQADNAALRNKIGEVKTSTEQSPEAPSEDFVGLVPQDEQLAEKYMIKMNVMKQEMNEQLKWELEKHKVFYEREMTRLTQEHQEEMRERLMELQEAIVGLKNAGPDGDRGNIGEIMERISNIFEDMNKHVEDITQQTVPVLPIEEAAERTRLLTDRLVELGAENQELKQQKGTAMVDDNLVRQLRKKVEYLESMQTHEQQDVTKKLQEMEEHYKHELEVKEQMLLNLSKIDEVFKNMSKKSVTTFDIYERAPAAEADPEDLMYYSDEEDVPQGTTTPTDAETPTSTATPNADGTTASNAGGPTKLRVRRRPQPVSRRLHKISMETSPAIVIDHYQMLVTTSANAGEQPPPVPTIVKEIIVPSHEPEERKLVETVVDEVFVYIPEAQKLTTSSVLSICSAGDFQATRTSRSQTRSVSRGGTTTVSGQPGSEAPTSQAGVSVSKKTRIRRRRKVSVKQDASTGPNETQTVEAPHEDQPAQEAPEKEYSYEEYTDDEEEFSEDEVGQSSVRARSLQNLSLQTLKIWTLEPTEVAAHGVGQKEVSDSISVERISESGPVISSRRVNSEEINKRMEELQQELEAMRSMQANQKDGDPTVFILKGPELDPLQPHQRMHFNMPLTAEQAEALNRKRRELTGIAPPKKPQPTETVETPVEDEKEEAKSSRSKVSEVEEPAGISAEEPTQLEVARSQTSESLGSATSHQSLSLQKDAAMVDVNADPFEAARDLVRSIMRYTTQFTNEEEALLRELGSSADAYDAYISAVDVKDESLYAFLQNIKQSKKDIEDHHAKLFQMNVASEKMAKLVNMMTTRYARMSDKVRQLENREAESTLAMQQELLTNIATTDANPNIPPALAQLETLHKLESSLELVANLGLSRDETLENDRSALIKRIKDFEQALTEDKPVQQEQVDVLVKDVQEFIGGVRNISPRGDDDDTEVEGANIDKLKSDLRRVRKMRDSFQRDLKYAKAREDALKQQIAQLNNRLATEKEMAENDIRAFKAQIATLRSTFDTLAGGGNQSPEEVASRVKKQILNMQSIMESSASERDMYKSKAEDAEEALKQAEETISELTHQVEELMMKAPMPAHRQTTEDDLFHDADMEQMQQEREADRVVAEQQRMQLETTVAENKILNERCHKLETDVRTLKRELDEARGEIDDLKLKNMTVSEPQRPPCLHKNIQCNMEPQSEAQKQTTRVIKTPKGTSKTQQKIVAPEKAVTPVVEDKPQVESREEEERPEAEKQEEEPCLPLQTVKTGSQLNLSQDITSSQNMGPSDVERTDTVAPLYEDDDEFGSLIDRSRDMQHQFNMEDVAATVHKPLDWARKKPKVILPTSEPRVKTHRTSRIHHHTHRTPTPGDKDLGDLTVNGAVQGKRSLTGTVGAIKPTVKTTTRKPSESVYGEEQVDMPPIENKSILHPSTPADQPPTEISNAAYSMTNKNVRESQQLLRQRQELLKEKTALEKLRSMSAVSEPIRITLVVNNPEKEKPESPLIITPQEITKPFVSAPHIAGSFDGSVRGTTIRKPEVSPELKEATKIISRLREQLRKVHEENEQKDTEIIKLKQKLSELTLQIHRLRLENIKHADNVKRTKIRYDNVKARLEITFKEIGIRDDEITQLKREILLLRKRQQPVASSVTKMQNAQREKERLKREEERRRQIAAVTRNALNNVDNEETRKHLTGILEHEHRSIARLEAQRRMWSEIERNHMMSVLSAMSLLSTSQYKTVRKVLPDYSPFATSKVSTIKQVLERSRYFRGEPDTTPANEPKSSPPRSIPYGDKIAALERVQNPPLTDEEKRLVVSRRESVEVEERIAKAIDGDRRTEVISTVRPSQS